MKEKEIREYADVCPAQQANGIVIGKLYGGLHRDPSGKVVSVSADQTRYKRNSVGGLVVDKKRSREVGRTVYEREPCKGVRNQNFIVFGALGSGKTTTYIVPNICGAIQRGESVVVTDSNGELYAATAELAKKNGYTIKILNANVPSCSDSWDVIGELMRTAEWLDVELMSLCQCIMENTGKAKEDEDKAYAAAEEHLLQALVSFVVYEMPDTKKKLASVLTLLDEDDDTLNVMFEAAEHEMPKRLWKNYYDGTNAFRRNLRTGLVTRLKVLRDETLKTITSVQDINMTLPGRERCVYYIVPDTTSTEKQLITSMFVHELFCSLVAYSYRDEQRGRLHVRVNFILNDFDLLGKIPDFDKKLAISRSAGISVSMIVQTIRSLKEQYPYAWEALVANCGTFLCLKCGDIESAEYIKDMCRRITTDGDDTSNIEVKDILTLEDDKCIIKFAQDIAFLANKVHPTDYEEWLIDIEQSNMYMHTPLWKAQQLAAEQESLNREMEAMTEYNERDSEKNASPTALGDTIRDARVESGWTQAELAEKMGVKQQTIANWEKGKRVPDLTSIKTLCEKFGIPFEEFTQRQTETPEERHERLTTGATDGFADVGIVDAATAMLWSAEFAKRRFGGFGDYQIQVAAQMLTFAMIVSILYDPAIEWWRDGLSNIVDVYSGSVSENCKVFGALANGMYGAANTTMIIGKGKRHFLEDEIGSNDIERLVEVALESFAECSNETKGFVGKTLPIMLMAQASETLATSQGYRRSPTIKAQLVADMCGGYLSLYPADCLHRYATASIGEDGDGDTEDDGTYYASVNAMPAKELKASRLEIPLGARYHVMTLFEGLNPVRKGYTFAGWYSAEQGGECVFDKNIMAGTHEGEKYEKEILEPLMKLMNGRRVHLYARWEEHAE